MTSIPHVTSGFPARENSLFAGVELGGTKCVCILARDPEDVVEQVVIPTRTGAQTLSEIADVIESWRFDALGIACFGPLDLECGAVAETPKPGWSGIDLTMLRRPSIPFRIDTDVNGAALAEGRWGGASGLANWAYITVGTGIGVGTIVNGRPIRGLAHSEAGHMRVPRGADTWSGICPFHGDCVEGLASGPAIAARIGLSGSDISANHPVWVHVADTLAALCHNLVLSTLPQRILIGGGVIQGQPQLLHQIRSNLVTSLAGYGGGRTVAVDPGAFLSPPALGAMAGPLGAIALAAAACNPKV